MKTARMTRYLCSFRFNNDNSVGVAVSTRGIDDFIHGFWVDKDLNFPCPFDKVRYYIPPHRILYIEKEIIHG